MDRDATFLLSLAAFAIAACTVGVTGWVLWSRGRVPRPSPTPASDHPPVTEES